MPCVSNDSVSFYKVSISVQTAYHTPQNSHLLIARKVDYNNLCILLAELEYAMSFVGQASVKKGLIVGIHISYVLVSYTSWMPFVITLRIVFSKHLQRQTKGFIS